MDRWVHHKSARGEDPSLGAISMTGMTPENPLEEALIAAATEPDARPTFYRLMLESTLFIIDDNPDNKADVGAIMFTVGMDLHVRTIEMNGVPHTPIFSSLARLRSFVDSERRYIAANGRRLLEIIQGSHLVLNPGSPYGKQFLPDETAAMLSGEIFRDYRTIEIQKPTSVLLGQPAHYPVHLTTALTACFRELPAVRAAYLAHCSFPDSTDPAHTMIGVDARGDWPPIIEAITQSLRQVRHDKEMVDILRIDDSDGSEVSQYMRKETKPFYRRKRFGLF